MYSRFVRKVLLHFSLLILTMRVALGWAEPPPPPDSKLVQISDCIVIAHAKDGSIQHPVLVITEILKGNPPAKEIPIIIPAPGTFMALKTNDNPGFPKGLTIWELGSMEHPICEDIRHDQIWFLRIDPKAPPGDANSEVPRIFEPGDIQPVDLKKYFEAFLTPHPEDVLKHYASGNSSLALRSETYLNHLAIEEILKEPDVQKRANLLLKYYLFTDDELRPPDQSEAALQLWENCGQTGAALLLPYFNDPKYKAMQSDIMGLWANAQYHGGIPLLIDMLDKETRFWQDQSPEQRDLWVDIRPGHSPTNEQIFSRLRIEMILFVFRQVPDPRATAEIAKVSPIWKQMFPGDAARNLGQELHQGLMIP